MSDSIGFTGEPPISIGINNSSNTCWLNTLLQMLIHIPFFHELIKILIIDLNKPILREINDFTNLHNKIKRLFEIFDKIFKSLTEKKQSYQLSEDDYQFITQNYIGQIQRSFTPEEQEKIKRKEHVEKTYLPKGRAEYHDFLEPFTMLFSDIDEFIRVLEQINSTKNNKEITGIITNFTDFKEVFIINTKETYYFGNDGCNEDNEKYTPPSINTTYLYFDKDEPTVGSIQQLIDIKQRCIKRDEILELNGGYRQVNSNKFNYTLSEMNQVLMIELNNMSSKLYVDPIIRINKQISEDIIQPQDYIINGVVCYTGTMGIGDPTVSQRIQGHYYFVSYNNGIASYLYDDNNVINLFTTQPRYNYTQHVRMAIYLPTDDANLIPKLKQQIQLHGLLENFENTDSSDKERIRKEILDNEAFKSGNPFTKIQFYSELIQQQSQSQESFFCIFVDSTKPSIDPFYSLSIDPYYESGKFIVNSVSNKEEYELFNMGDTMKQQYDQSIQFNTEQFKSVYDENESKSTEKEVDIENTYNSTTKEKPVKKYSMFYYNTNEL